jgi:hypothetical protein
LAHRVDRGLVERGVRRLLGAWVGDLPVASTTKITETTPSTFLPRISFGKTGSA